MYYNMPDDIGPTDLQRLYKQAADMLYCMVCDKLEHANKAEYEKFEYKCPDCKSKLLTYDEREGVVYD